MEYKQHYDNSYNERFIKTMVAWKVKENSDSEVINKIKSNFNDPEKFLKMDNDLIVGKKINQFKYANKDTLKPYHIIGDMENIFPTIKPANKNANDLSTFPRKQYSAKMKFNNSLSNSPTKKKSNLENFSEKVSFLNNTPLRSMDAKTQNDFELLSDQQIEKMFKEKKEKLTVVSSVKLNNDIIKNIDPKCVAEMKEFLTKQEKALENKATVDKKLNNLAKFIAKKTKKNEKELLINKIDGSRLKNQCIQRIQSSNPLKPYKYGVDNDWRLNLRKYDNEADKSKKNNLIDADIDGFRNRIGSSRIMNNPTVNIRKSKSRNEWGTRTLLNIRNGDDLGMVIFDDNQEIEQVVKPNTACLKDFRKYADNRTISSRLRNMNLNCEEMIGVNNLNVNTISYFFEITFLYIFFYFNK